MLYEQMVVFKNNNEPEKGDTQQQEIIYQSNVSVPGKNVWLLPNPNICAVQYVVTNAVCTHLFCFDFCFFSPHKQIGDGLTVRTWCTTHP